MPTASPDPAKLDALIQRYFSELPDGTLVIKKADFLAKFLPLYDKLTPGKVTIPVSTKRASSGPNWGSVPGLVLTQWERWVKYRKEIGKPLKTTRPAFALVALAGKDDIETQKAIIEQSMANEWVGLFPLKHGGPKKWTKPEPERKML